LVDLIKLAQAATANDLLNPDLASDLQRLWAKLDLKALYAYYDKVLISRAQLSTQLNKQLLIESLLIDWSQLSQS
jgi:DNA polymerase-3 subunit delta'